MARSTIFVLGSFVAACSAKVARLPLPGESLCAEAFTVEAGGKGLNLAIGARRLGASVDGLLAVGNDMFSNLAEPALMQAGLPPQMLRRYDDVRTGSGIGFTDAEGENCLAVYPGANLKLSAADVRGAAGALTDAKLVLAQFEIGNEPIIEAFTRTRAAGGTTLLNPSPYRTVDIAILERTSILVVNQIELADMAAEFGLTIADGGSAAAEPLVRAATILLDRGPQAVVVTLGANGALACQSSRRPLYQAAFAVQAVDTLGAGDAFTAGLAVSLAEDRPWGECLHRAAACGAMATRKLGVFDALPMRGELEDFLASCD